MHELNGKSMIELALETPITGLVLAARSHVTHCITCAETMTSLLDQHVFSAETATDLQPISTSEKVGTLIIQFTEQVANLLQVANSLHLADAIMPASELSYQYKLDQDEAATRYHYIVDDIDQVGFWVDLEVEIAEDQDTCFLVATVAKSRPTTRQNIDPLVGATIRFSWAEESEQVKKTDVAGEAFFDALPTEALATLAIEIIAP